MSYRKYGELRGVSGQAIQDRVKRGTISQEAILQPETERNPSKRVMIDSDIADKDFFRNVDPAKKIAAHIALPTKPVVELKPITEEKPIEKSKTKSDEELKRQTPNTVAPKPEIKEEVVEGQKVKVVVEPPAEDGYSRLTKAKSISEELRSRKIELEVMELEGRLVDVNDVKDRLETKITEVRTALLNAADKVALEVLGKKDLLEIKSIIKSSINQALTGLQRIDNDFQ